MSHMFESFDNADIRNLMSEQLKRQVDVGWPNEAICLEGHGLKNATTVLDIGTGNGYFLCKMAERYPDKQFTGIEPNPELVEIAEKNIKEKSLTNITLINDQCPTKKITTSFDFVYARLCLYLAENRVEILSWAHEHIEPGRQICIIDVDHGSYYPDDPEAPLAKLHEAIKKRADDDGADRNIGKKLPYLLQKAGFSDIRTEGRYWYSTIGMAPDDFAEFWGASAYVFNAFMPDYYCKESLNELIRYLEEIKSGQDHVAINPIFFVSGTRS